MIRCLPIAGLTAMMLLGSSAIRAQPVSDGEVPRHPPNLLPGESHFTLIDSSIFTETFDGQIFPPPGWTVINRDNGTLTPWFQGNSSSAIPPFDSTGFAADNFQRANGTYLDDYLISPVIAGVGGAAFFDSLVFYTRSILYAPPVVNVPDSLMIMVSTSGPDTAALSYVLDYINVPKGQWTRFAYALTGVVPPNSNIHFAFRYLHFAGGQSGAGSDFVGVDRVQVMRNPATGVGETPATSFELFQNYPNPFNPTTAISYQLSASSFVTLSVYDLMGRNVATLVHETQHPGRHTVQFDGSGLASGVYFYKIQAGWFVQTRKLLLLR